MTYLDHFKLNESPFRLTPDPDFIYMSEQHTRAKSYMGSTIWFDDGFVVITGEVGSGKTTMLQSFIGELDDDTVCAVISQTQLTPTQFLEAVLHEFGFQPFNKSKVELLAMLNDFLIEQYADGKKVVLIVDEAQNLGWKVLEEIRLLSGVESHKEKVLRIILVGQPELKETLESKQLRQLMQRVRCRFHLGPLTEEETREYILHRLQVAGESSGTLLEDDAFDIVFKYSGGVPRMVNTLCDTAFLCAFAEDRAGVGATDVMTAVGELGWQEYNRTSETASFPYLTRLASTPVSRDSIIRIDVRESGKVVTEHYFGPGRIIVGRSAQAEICIASKFISRQHAEIVCTEEACYIRDLGSTNGIYVRGKRLQEHTLSDRDIISLGTFDLVYTDLREVSGSDWHNYSGVDEYHDEDEDSAIHESLA